jgi:hypothetical protein
MKDILQPLFNQFMPFAQKRMGFNKPPRVFLRDDPENAQNPLGKTAYYDPEQMSVTLKTMNTSVKWSVKHMSKAICASAIGKIA